MRSEAVFDALTFWQAGFRNVSCLFGTEGFTDELWEAMKRVRCVRIAYDGDDAGERAALRDAARFGAAGIEVYRIKFPHGMDANQYAQKVQPAAKSLALLVNSAQWLSGVNAAASSSLAASLLAADTGKATKEKSSPKPEPLNGENVNAGHDIEEPTAAQTSPAASTSTPVMQPSDGEPLPSPSLASTSTRRASEAAVHGVQAPPAMEQRGDAFFFHVDEREYRVGGLEKTIGTDALKITLRLRHGDRFHLDQIDLCRDAERRRFMDRAAEETGLSVELLKRDLGKLLLAVEQTQAELAKPTEEATRTVSLSPEEREAALAWLKAPNLIERLRQAFHQAGIIGEETNTLIAYLAGVSRKLEHPLAIIIQSASAAGKTTLMDAVLSFFPEEERLKYSAMTGQSLYYLGETNLKHKILAVVEEAGAERASYALKLLQSEGELTIASTGKDPQSGKMVTQEYHVEGPVMIFLTTTAIDLDEELQNRCLTLTVDESAEQTGRIHQLQRERRTLAGLVAREERRELLKILRNAQRLLNTVAVVNPYAPALTFPTGRTRNRRDHEKYLGLIDAIALLHQHQRQTRTLPSGQPFLEVTLDDIALANELVPEVLSRSLDELPPQTRRLLDHIRDLLQQRRADTKTGSSKMGPGSAWFSRKELREHCQWSLTQLRVHLDRLVELEYLGLRQGRLGHRFVYEILVDLDAPEAVAHVGLIDVERLRTHDYDGGVTGFERGVAGLNGGVTGGGQTAPPPLETLRERHLSVG
jgi:Toprim-like